jgi:CheY-like chemotaxis protein
LSALNMDMMAPGRILVIDDEPPVCELVRDALLPQGHEVTIGESAEVAIEQLACAEFDAVVTDLHLQGMDGLGLCRYVTNNRPGLPVIVATGYGNVESAVGALRAGAYDFVMKPLTCRPGTGRPRAGACAADREVPAAAEVRPRGLDELLGEHTDAASAASAGKIGTSERADSRARAVRARSLPRAHTRFAAMAHSSVDCASIPATVLRGAVRSHAWAFTDAHADRRAVRRANGGTLFRMNHEMLPHCRPSCYGLLRGSTCRSARRPARRADHRRYIATRERRRRRFRRDSLSAERRAIDLPPPRAGGTDAVIGAALSRAHRSARGSASTASALRTAKSSWPTITRKCARARKLCRERSRAGRARQNYA